MIFAELFVGLVAILLIVGIVRVAAKKWRRAGVVGKMHQVVEVEELAGDISRFQKEHPKADAAQKTVDKFQGQ